MSQPPTGQGANDLPLRANVHLKKEPTGFHWDNSKLTWLFLIGGLQAQVARGKVGQQDDRALARELAREVILADLLEFHRLMEQFEEIREWLLT